jgi:hypothetical protein
MIMRLIASLVFLALAAATAAAEPAAFSLDYAVSRNGKALGEATLSLERINAETWMFRTHTVGTEGLASFAGVEIDERSEFRWSEGRPETLRYSFNQEMRFKSKKRSLSVMPNASRVSGRDGDGEYNLEYEPGLLDRNLVVLALAGDIARDEQQLQYRVADKRKIDTNEYRAMGPETLDTPRGKLEAVRVERLRRDSGRKTTIWIAPALDHLPIRILQVEPDGETLDMRLR